MDGMQIIQLIGILIVMVLLFLMLLSELYHRPLTTNYWDIIKDDNPLTYRYKIQGLDEVLIFHVSDDTNRVHIEFIDEILDICTSATAYILGSPKTIENDIENGEYEYEIKMLVRSMRDKKLKLTFKTKDDVRQKYDDVIINFITLEKETQSAVV